MLSPSSQVKKFHQGPGKVWLFPDVPATGARLIIDVNGNPIVPAAGYPSWVALTAYARGAKVKDGATPANTLIALVAGTSGTPTEPTTPTNIGDMVADGTGSTAMIWVNAGPWGALYAGAIETATTLTLTPKNEETGADQVPGPLDVIQTAEAAEIDVTMKELSFDRLSLVITNGLLALATDALLPAGSQNVAEISFGGIRPVPRQSIAFISPRRDDATKYIVGQLWQAYQSEAAKVAATRLKETLIAAKFKGLYDDSRTDMCGKLYKQL
jgi:hypothetical protein